MQVRAKGVRLQDKPKEIHYLKEQNLAKQCKEIGEMSPQVNRVQLNHSRKNAVRVCKIETKCLTVVDILMFMIFWMASKVALPLKIQMLPQLVINHPITFPIASTCCKKNRRHWHAYN